MHGKTPIDPAVDPAPDLVIEVEITTPALNKLPIHADFQVPEIWRRYNGAKLVILLLSGHEYVESRESLVFPKVSADDLSRLVRQSTTLKRREWRMQLRNWLGELQ